MAAAKKSETRVFYSWQSDLPKATNRMIPSVTCSTSPVPALGIICWLQGWRPCRSFWMTVFLRHCLGSRRAIFVKGKQHSW